MRILFITPKLKTMYGGRQRLPGHPHVGVAYLTSFLKENGIKVDIFNEAIEGDDDLLYERINKFNPALIGITIFSYCYGRAFDTINKVKRYCRIPIVAGGPHISATKSEILEETKADFAIKGEGELSLLELATELGSGSHSYDKICGLIWRDGKTIIENPDRPFIEDLDKLPLPDYYAFKIERYSCFESKALPIITSRGCPFGCNFCSVRLSMGRRFRARSPENVVDELEYWNRDGWRIFDINDDCFTLDMERAAKICNLIEERNLKIRYQLYNGIRPDRVDKDLLVKMKRSGCIFISYGCEAGNNDVLKSIKKGITLDQVRKAVNLTNQVGIKHSVNFIIGHPCETFEKAMDSIRLAKELPSDFVNFYNLVPYPSTELFEWAKENADWTVPMDTYLKEVSYREDTPIFETREFTMKEKQQVIQKGFALYERTILQFRLGKILGYIAYLVMRNRTLAKIGLRFFLESRIGKRIYIIFSLKSKT